MKFNGYRPTFKNKWLFLRDGVLTLQGLMLLEFYADIFDFGWNHERYGLFEVDFRLIGQIFDSSENTIRNWHNELLKKGFIEKTNKKHFFKLACFERFVPPGNKWKGKSDYYERTERDQPIEKILQSFGLEFQQIAEKFQHTGKTQLKEQVTTSSAASKYLTSSKSRFNSISPYENNTLKSEIRNSEEYEKIHREGNYSILTPQDMENIDENVTETIKTDRVEVNDGKINSDTDSKENYKQHLIF